jgi:hypothetical protein
MPLLTATPASLREALRAGAFRFTMAIYRDFVPTEPVPPPPRPLRPLSEAPIVF